MKKLRMNLDELRVESFATEHDPGPGDGTVWGHQEALRPKPDTYNAACNITRESCYHSCQGGACSFESCPGTCPYQGTCHETCARLCIRPEPQEPPVFDTLIGFGC